jgi:hypothetical protein
MGTPAGGDTQVQRERPSTQNTTRIRVIPANLSSPDTPSPSQLVKGVRGANSTERPRSGISAGHFVAGLRHGVT